MGRGGGRGGGGGFSGGGRSFGGGGSRSFGGRSSAGRGGSFGSSAGRSSRSSGTGYRPSGSSYRSGNRNTIFVNNSRPSYGGYNSGGYRPSGGQQPPKKGGSGTLTTVILILVIALLLIAVFVAVSDSSASGITGSTVERTPLPAGSVNETAYFDDQLGWIESPSKLKAGMKSFYEATGVQPYLYITDEVYGSHSPTTDQLDQYVNELYDQLFTDEAHMLVLFLEWEGAPSVYWTRYVCGVQAKTVIDEEAADILLDYIDRNYYDSDLDETEFFANSFEDAGERIMQVTKSPWIPILSICAVAAVLAVVAVLFQQKRKAEAAKAKELEDMLSKPLETFDDKEAEDLAKKYENAEDPVSKYTET